MQVLNIFHVLVAIAMVAFILVQRGPGATAGAAFGSGASGTVFGARGAGSFLSRSTWVLATLFCLISLTMAVVVSRNLAAPKADQGIMGSVTQTQQGEPVAQQPAAQQPATPEQSPAGEQQPADLPAVDQNEAAPAGDDLPAQEPETDKQSGSGDGGGSGQGP